MTMLELGSDLVTPSWLPLALVIVIGAVIVFLYRSMRHNIDRIEVPHRDEVEAAAGSPSATLSEQSGAPAASQEHDVPR